MLAHLLTWKQPPEWVSVKPKRFAWTLGLAMTFAMTIIINSGIRGWLPRSICLICLTLMWLESVLGLTGKDAVFLSPHKFVGGPGTPGVLVAKRALFRNRVPTVPGGGTVLFVTPDDHTYHPDPSVREEGGTPAIVESIRAGLVFALKDDVGADVIRRRERDLARRALASWGANPNIETLGNPSVERLPIISFGLRHPPRLLHCNFVVALLNDLFGIQARSGCFCAGPYLHRIYRVDKAWSARMEAECRRGHIGAKLGFVRLSFSYFISDEVF